MISVLFLSGCNSVINTEDMDVGKMAEEVKILPTYQAVPKIMTGMPDYVQVDQNTKYADPDGISAFFIPAQDSRKKEDIKSFDFLGTAGNHTVVYSYATKIISGDGKGSEVHCVAKYNYENKQYEELHRSIGAASSDLKAFQAQQLKGQHGFMGVAVYDRGKYYYYDLNGNLKIRSSIGNFIKKQYMKNASMQITEIVGRNAARLYLLLTIQKNEITGKSNGRVDWDKLSDDIEKEVQTRILVYDLQPIDDDYQCIQSYTNYDDAVGFWKDMTDGEEFTKVPDAKADWEKAKNEYPIEPGVIYLKRGGIQWPVYTCDDKVKFLSEDGSGGKICNFKVDMNGVKEKKEITDSKFTEEDLLVIDGNYYKISGDLSNKKIVRRKISRTYTYVDAEGNTQEDTQKLEVPSYQTLTIKNGFLEGFWLLPNEISGLYGATDHELLASEGRELFWMDDNGKRNVIYDGLTQDTMVAYDAMEASPYSILVDRDSLNLFFDRGGYYQIPFDKFIYGYGEGTTESDKKLEESAGAIGDLYSQRERFSKWQILNIQDNDFLIASQKNGLMYYEGDTGKIRQIEKGTWFAVWEETGGSVVAAGFKNQDSGYDGKDLIYAAIKRYSKDDLIHIQ